MLEAENSSHGFDLAVFPQQVACGDDSDFPQPSRVYARWKWTVRFGLSAMPLTLFIAGGVTYYLTPSRYESTAVFEYLGKRPPAEAAALLRSRGVIGWGQSTRLNRTQP